jgi:hypothetical protein
MIAMGAAPGGGFVGASGSPKFVGAVVGGSILVGAIVQAARESQAYNACMEALGFVVDDAPHR